MKIEKRLNERRWAAAAVSVTLALAGGIVAPTSAMAIPRMTQQASSSTIDAKYAAAAVLGWVPREEVALSDRDFVIVLWEKASERHNPEVKEAARLAFSDSSDAQSASTYFITTGIFAANDRDATLKTRRAELDTIRLRAAQEINWVSTTTTERNTMLDQTLQNFTQDLWRHASSWPAVKKAVEPLTSSDATDDQRLAFLKTDLFTKAEVDRQAEIANGNAAQVANQRAAAVRTAKEKAIAVALRRSPTTYELDDLDDHELIHEFATDSPGTHVKAAATVAYADSSSSAWLAFIFTGVHLANKIDLDERDLAEARANEVKVRDIMYAAEADGFQPSVVAAAKAALEGVALARSQFLLSGKDTAMAADTIRPSANRVVMLQAVGYSGCISEPIPWFYNSFGGWKPESARLDPCKENLITQRWTLSPDSSGRYQLTNSRMRTCLSIAAENLQVDGAPVTHVRCGELAGAAESWELLDGGQGYAEIRNVTSNKVLTAAPGPSSGALNLVQSPNGHATTQKWRLIDPIHQAAASKPPVGSFRIKGVQSGRCARSLSTTTLGVDLRDCSTDADQIWDVVTLPDTHFALRNRASQKCLGQYHNNITTLGLARVQDGYACDTPAGAWAAMFNESSSVHIRSVETGYDLAAPDNATANGTLISQAEYTTTPSQQWIFDPISDGAVTPSQIWTASGRLPAFAGTAVTFQPSCTSNTVDITSYSGQPYPWIWRADAGNTNIKGAIRIVDAIGFYPSNRSEAQFQYCATSMLSNDRTEVTLKSTAMNAYVRGADNVGLDGTLVADQTRSENAERFVLQNRNEVTQPDNSIFTMQFLQSKRSNKFASVDSTATGNLTKVLRFTSKTPTAASEFYMSA